MFAFGAGSGAAGDRGEAGVGGQVPGGGEVGGVADFERMRAAVLTPMPGIETSDLANGQAAAGSVWGVGSPKALIGS
jgi:hypothetical protein